MCLKSIKLYIVYEISKGLLKYFKKEVYIEQLVTV